MGPKRGEDGKLVVDVPDGRQAKLPSIAAEDIGKFAYGIFKRGDEFIGKTVGVAGEHLSGEEMADALTKALGEEVRYNDVDPDVYRSFGFPGADDLGNMFQFKWEFEEEYRGNRDLALTRTLNPELQTLDQWLAENVSRIPDRLDRAPTGRPLTQGPPPVSPGGEGWLEHGEGGSRDGGAWFGVCWRRAIRSRSGTELPTRRSRCSRAVRAGAPRRVRSQSGVRAWAPQGHAHGPGRLPGPGGGPESRRGLSGQGVRRHEHGEPREKCACACCTGCRPWRGRARRTRSGLGDHARAGKAHSHGRRGRRYLRAGKADPRGDRASSVPPRCERLRGDDEDRDEPLARRADARVQRGRLARGEERHRARARGRGDARERDRLADGRLPRPVRARAARTRPGSTVT